MAVAEEAGDFDTLLAAVDSAGLTSTLTTGGPFTLFAPTDEAFAALPAGTLDALLADPEALTEVLFYHVVAGELTASDLESRSYVTTAQGQDIAVTTLMSINLNGVPVSQADIEANNGVIHVIDQVLLPPTADLVQTASDAGNFTTLVAAIAAAGLASALQGPGPFTVFAPTEAAFAALPAGTLDALLADPPTLMAMLQYHVVDGKLYSGDLRDAVSAQTLAGFPILFPFFGAQVNNSLVGPANVLATNGVLHVIDTVLLPPAKDIFETATEVGLSTLITAIEAADLVNALQAPGPFTVFAPMNAAFDELAPGTLDALLQDPEALSDILLYHVAEEQFFAGELIGVTTLHTLQGQSLLVDLSTGILINDASVSTADFITRNGVIHLIDKVLLPN